MLARLLLLSLASILLSSEALGAAESATVKSADVFSAGAVLQLILGLVFVIGLFLGCIWMLKRFGPSHLVSSKDMRVVAGLALSAREKVLLVQVGDRQVLLGVAPGQVNFLCRFDEPVIVPPEAPEGEFSRRLATLMKGQSK